MRVGIIVMIAACGGSSSDHIDAGQDVAMVDASSRDAVAQYQGLITMGGASIDGGAGFGIAAIFTSGPPLGSPITSDGPCATYPFNRRGERSAGTISVTGSMGTGTLTPVGAPPQVDYASSLQPMQVLFSPNDTVHVVGSGGPDFGSFAGDVTAPSVVMGAAVPTTMSYQGYTVTWTAATATTMLIHIIARDGTNDTQMYCRVPDNGAFAVPASSFALLPADAVDGSFVLLRVTETTIATASGSVVLDASFGIGTNMVTLTH